MKVIVAKTAGFCKGVKDALEVTLEAIQKRKDGERICTYGPVIHNRQVLAMLDEPTRFRETESGPRFTLSASETEWLLQVLND